MIILGKTTKNEKQQDDWAAQVSRLRRTALAWRLAQWQAEQQGDGGGDAMDVANANANANGGGEQGKQKEKTR